MTDDEFRDHEAFGFATRAIRAGQPHDPTTGAVVTPISLATTYAQLQVGEHRGFEYSRSGNPTRAALEACVASLDVIPQTGFQALRRALYHFEEQGTLAPELAKRAAGFLDRAR